MKLTKEILLNTAKSRGLELNGIKSFELLKPNSSSLHVGCVKIVFDRLSASQTMLIPLSKYNKPRLQRWHFECELPSSCSKHASRMLNIIPQNFVPVAKAKRDAQQAPAERVTDSRTEYKAKAVAQPKHRAREASASNQKVIHQHNREVPMMI